MMVVWLKNVESFFVFLEVKMVIYVLILEYVYHLIIVSNLVVSNRYYKHYA